MMSASEASQNSANHSTLASFQNASFHNASFHNNNSPHNPNNGSMANMQNEAGFSIRASASVPAFRAAAAGLPFMNNMSRQQMTNATFDMTPHLQQPQQQSSNNMFLGSTSLEYAHSNKRMRRSDMRRATSEKWNTGGSAVTPGTNSMASISKPRYSNGNMFLQNSSNLNTIHDNRVAENSELEGDNEPISFSTIPEQNDASSAKMQIAAMDTDSLLHNSCKLYPQDYEIVESALQLDPDAIRRSIPISCAKGTPSTLVRISPPKKYSFPINIAIQYGADIRIIALLANNGPDVLVQADGPNRTNSLSIALQCDATREICNALLHANPACASVADRHSNAALHWAVRSPVVPNMERIHRILSAYPEAVRQKNFHGETPLDIAIRNPASPEAVLSYLQQASFGHLEEEAMRNLDLL
jgi:hypothetical protein